MSEDVTAGTSANLAETPNEDPRKGETRRTLSREVVSGTVTGYVVDPSTGEKLETTYKDITGEERERLDQLEREADAARRKLREAEGLTDAEAERLRQEAADAEQEFERLIINEYHLDEDFTVSNTGTALKQAIAIGFLRALGADNESIREAEAFFDERLSGNR